MDAAQSAGGGRGGGGRTRRTGPPDPPNGHWAEHARKLGIDVPAGAKLYREEYEFLEEFVQEHDVPRWLPTGHVPTNDFEWAIAEKESIEVELKTPENVNYRAIANRINDDVEKVIKARERTGEALEGAKTNFIVDIGDATLPDDVRADLALYNQRNPTKRISRLWVWSQRRLITIDLA